ncbi:MAG: glycosyltransferase family 2 protein [Vicinamibacterales bacterium]
MLSIIIVGHNCADVITPCLRSLHAHPPTDAFEVIYVDNASRDGSARLVADTFPSVRVIPNTRNEGYQAANNRGLDVARGDILLLLNPDTVIRPGAIDTLARFLRERPSVGAASPRCVFPDGRLQWTVAPFPSLAIIRHWFWQAHPALARLRGRSLVASGPAEVSTREQDYAYGACLAVKRDVIAVVGRLDERYFLVGGEVAWSREIRRAGWQVFHVAEAEIEHHESVARKRRSWLSELDWVTAHRRLLYTYEGLRAGMVGDLLFSVHLVLFAGARLARPMRSGPRARDVR